MSLLKIFFSLLISLLSICAKAQKIESLHVDLYTDSLKKGTYNYINIDGKLANGKYIPLDTSEVILTSSDGKFSGNSLWIESNFIKEKIDIKVVLKSDPSMHHEFTMFIKKKPDDEKLKTMDELMNETNSKPAGKRKG